MEERVQELQKLLQDAKLRADKAEEERQDAKLRADIAEGERQDAKLRADKAEEERQDAQRRADKAEEQVLRTTLHEYIEACHHLVSSRLLVETNRNLTSKGSITNPHNKLCPTSLKPWSDFLELQKQALGTVFSLFPTEHRAFESRNFLAGLGERISQKPLANEKDLEHFLHNAVEEPVRSIIAQIKATDEVKRTFGIGDGVVFDNHPHALSDVADEVAQRQAASSPPRTPTHGSENLSSQLRPDQICVYLSETMERLMIFVCEYKAAHKLTAPHIRVGLHPMNIYEDVVNRKTIPTSADPDALFQYHAEKLTAAAITQTRHYMIIGGLEYGLLTTGEAIVFLKIDWQEPQTLYYHLAEPTPESLAHPDNIHSCAAVGQYLAFVLIALGSPGQRREHPQDERRQVIKSSKRWAQDFETTIRAIPTDEWLPPPDSPAYEPTTYKSVNRAPYVLRPKIRPLFAPDPSDDGPSRKDPTDSDDDDESPGKFPDTPSPAEKRPRQAQPTRRSDRVLAQQQRGGEQSRQYCTQKCLLGLVNERELDQECPNVASHRGKKASTRHPVTHTKWLQLLYEQLERSLDDGIRRLNKEGSRGVLFQVTLIAYGYTFVSKGTISAFIEDLQHEAAVYERLRPVQGITVPVFLGSIDLRDMDRVYYYDHRVYIVHLTFLSWGGYKMDELSAAGAAKMPLAAKVERSLRSIHRRGVVHGDVRKENVLTVLIIDFERALLLQPPRSPLLPLVPNKKALMQQTPDTKKRTTNHFCDPTSSVKGFQQDIATAKWCFQGSSVPKAKPIGRDDETR
ncbi:hypothetical protein TOPH_04667 [Tolypocladium ophioglossoides CBS 100239]|uniref:Uncharacterized protein n=1 Tax=Tolypocladium ophioglossoides (strain CBS 100239) TaxID=1163406 RepID=A0A0L0N900_TOLOC|nr:hypothetical protein TOPH_04667 [Tolypocladium ophioglossoides CBS 100239]